MTQQSLTTAPAWKLGTVAVHGGYSADPTTRAAAVPIYQTVAFAFDDTQHGADLFSLKISGNIYSRIMNPINDALEKCTVALEGDIGASALTPGQTTVTYTIQTTAEADGNIVLAGTLYGSTYSLFAYTLPLLGITMRFVGPRDPASFETLIDDRARIIFVETVGNPLGNITDITTLAETAYCHGVPLVIDNIVPAPYLMRPFEHGANIVIHSLTKYLGGHGINLGGAIVDSGKLPRAKHKVCFKWLNELDVNYHDVIYTEALGDAAYTDCTRVMPPHNTGVALSPSSAFLILQGIEMLGLCIDRITQNAAQVARHLRGHAKVEWASHVSLGDRPDHALVCKYLSGRMPELFTFGVKGGFAAEVRFQDALQLSTRLVNIGDAKPLVTHPAPTMHRQLSEAEFAKASVRQETIRLPTGIEHINDLPADLDQILAQV